MISYLLNSYFVTQQRAPSTSGKKIKSLTQNPAVHSKLKLFGGFNSQNNRFTNVVD